MAAAPSGNDSPPKLWSNKSASQEWGSAIAGVWRSYRKYAEEETSSRLAVSVVNEEFIMPLIIPLSSKPSFSVGGFPLHRTTRLSLNSAPRATDFEDCFECFRVCLARLVSHVNVLQFLMSIWLWPWSSDTAYCIATVSQESLQQCYNFILLVSGELLSLCLLLGCPSSSPSPDQSPCTPALAHNNHQHSSRAKCALSS